MPSREQTIADAVEIFENAEYPSNLTPKTAWLGIYQALLWYEPVDGLLIANELPHIIDANNLNPPNKKTQNINAWQARAVRINSYLAEQLKCSDNEVPSKVDLLIKHPSYGRQRQNSLGIAFSGLIAYVLQKFGASQFTYETEVNVDTIFPGQNLAGRSTQTGIDILVRDNGIPVALISAKWSVRHDRINDITNECPIYKSAYQTVYRRNKRRRLYYYVITNEYATSRLLKMIDDPCIDGVVHLHKPAIVDVLQQNGRMNELLDLTDLVNLTNTW